jgi:hypothetical protein
MNSHVSFEADKTAQFFATNLATFRSDSETIAKCCELSVGTFSQLHVSSQVASKNFNEKLVFFREK